MPHPSLYPDSVRTFIYDWLRRVQFQVVLFAMLLYLVNSCSSVAKAIVFNKDGIKIDNIIDSSHKVVSLLLATLFIILTANQYAVDPIKCNTGLLKNDMFPTSMIENYCYFGKAYVDLSYINKINEKLMHGRHCADLQRTIRGHPLDNEKSYQTLYYWMQYIILLQSFCFAIPKLFWEKCEKGKLREFISLLSKFKEKKEKTQGKGKEEEEAEAEKDCFEAIALKKFWIKHFNKQNSYFFLYLTSELLYLGNVASQFYFVDMLLNHENGWELIKEAFELGVTDLCHYFSLTFPVMTKCTLPIFDTNNEVTSTTFTCVLTLNYLYKKIAIILWILFSIVMFLTCINIIMYTFIPLIPRSIRSRLLRKYYNIQTGDDIEDFFAQEILIGDWFFLAMLKLNMDSLTQVWFEEFIVKNLLKMDKKVSVEID